VLEYCFYLAEIVGYPESQIPELARAALLHDIGKIGIPTSILRKPSRLTKEEFDIMKSHVLKGVRILERVPTMRACIPIVLNHHEDFDGTGYPNGRRNKEIPLGARIFAVDALDAMTSDRPYRDALPFDKAMTEIQRCAGQQFDPIVASAFLQVPAGTWKELRSRADTSAMSSEQLLMRVLRRNLPRADFGCSSYESSKQVFA
jgi:HD-GYP domain-containing protein (c-di-GMP phosphodiesterase class II)